MKLKLLLLLIFTMLLSACTLPTRYERNPSKTGFGNDSMKKSRCSCIKAYQNGEWLL